MQICSSQTTLEPETMLMSPPAQIFPCTRPGARLTFPFTAMMLPPMTALQQLAPPPPPEVETSFPTLRSRLAVPASVRMSAPPERLTLPPMLTTKVTPAFPFVLKKIPLLSPVPVTSPVTQMTFCPPWVALTVTGPCSLLNVWSQGRAARSAASVMQSLISALRSWLHSIPPVNLAGRPWNDEQLSLRRPLPCTVPGLENDSLSRPPGPTQMSPSIPGEGPVMSTLPPPSWRMTHSSMSSPKLGLMQLPVGGIGVNTHPVAGLQAAVGQVLLSLQVMGVNTQPVAGLQVSVVQALLSLQVMGVKTQPVAGLQVSVVHALLSLQVMGVKTHPVAGLQVWVVPAVLSLQAMCVKTQPGDGVQGSVVQ